MLWLLYDIVSYFIYDSQNLLQLSICIICEIICIIFALMTVKYVLPLSTTSKKTNYFLAVLLSGFYCVYVLTDIKKKKDNSKKICNKCGAEIVAEYPVCKHCLNKDDFTYDNEETSKILDLYKTKLIPYSIISIIFIFCPVLIKFIFSIIE